MTHTGIDLSHYQNPFALPYADWLAHGLEVVVIKISDGTGSEPVAEEHLTVAMAAGVPHLGAYHYLQPGNGNSQCMMFLTMRENAYTFSALDVEQVGVTAQDVLDWIITYERQSAGIPLVLYGNNTLLGPIMQAHPEIWKYLVWWAEYPTYPQTTSVPPFPMPHGVPSGLSVAGWQFAGDNGRLAPYASAIDLSVWYQIPGGPMTPSVLSGALYGMHAQEPGRIVPILDAYKAQGVSVRALNSVENPGLDRDAHDRGVLTTIARFKNPNDRWEGGQDADTWSDSEIASFCQQSIQMLFDRTNPWERAGVTHWIPGYNEWNPSGAVPGDSNATDWSRIATIFMRLMDEAEARSAEFGQPIRLVLPNVSQGTPQYNQMQQFLATGIGDRMALRDDRFGVHEGPFTGQPIDIGSGDIIPGAPAVPQGAGSAVGRIYYWISLGLKAKFVVTEAYDGLDRNTPVGDRLARMRYMDQLYRHSPLYDGACFFELEINPSSQWFVTDFTPVFDVPPSPTGPMLDELLAERDTPNPIPFPEDTMPITQAEKNALLADANSLLTKINAIGVDDWWNALPLGTLTPSRVTTNLLTTLDFYHTPTDATPYTTRTYSAPGVATIDVYERAGTAGDMLRVTQAPAGIIWCKAEQLKAFT